MIMARAPFRISFAGGGSDLKEFYSNNDYGAVLSTTIDKYMYIMIHSYFHDKIRIKYSKTEDVNEIEEIQHPLVRECLKLVGIKKGIEIASIADVPAGTGLGSSSSFTLCLLQALYAFKGMYANKEKLVTDACKIEIDILNEPIGKQDQYAAGYGGLKFIQFNNDGKVFVEPVGDVRARNHLEKNLLMFYLGNERKTSQILDEQKKNMEYANKVEIMKKMVGLAEDMKVCVKKNKFSLFGEMLHEGWLLKKQLATKISNPIIDEYYEKALKAGASGGKLLGAGGGGFFLFYCEPKKQNTLREKLKLKEFRFKFESEGSKIVYMD